MESTRWPRDAGLSCPMSHTAPAAMALQQPPLWECGAEEREERVPCSAIEMYNFITHHSILPWQLVTSQAVKIPLKNEGSMANY